ncbi:MAG: glucose-6-phosphate isomerase [Clostridiales bacterium]|nr:glucose-6-phosphate isomerase [Clostridiales bacterium]
MNHIKFDYSQALLNANEFDHLKGHVQLAHQMLHEKTGAGNDYVGWVDYTKRLTQAEIEDIQQTADKIREAADAFIIIGIGGSYLGAKTVLDALMHPFHNELTKSERQAPKIYFAGNQISSTYMAYLLERIEGESVYINVISKSGTTTEPAIAFRLLKAALESKYGKEGAQKRIVATTDRERGALRTLADREGYKTFVIPDDVGGRYSVITPVGLLPIAVGGIDLKAFLNGVNDGVDAFANPLVAENPAYQYAVLRNVLYRKGKAIEVLVNYEPSMAFLAEWWMQLFGESEGKDNMGVFPTKMNNSTDLHSMGQMIQDGPRIMFETVITLDTVERDIVLEADADNLDGLNYLAGKKMSEVNQSAFQGTVEAHVDGNVPNLHVSMPKLDAYHLGHLMYFFMKACGISGYLMGVNPFDQPGVEAYKKNMFRLLGKPM